MSSRSSRLTRSATLSALSSARRVTRSSTRNQRQDRTNAPPPRRKIAAGDKEHPIELLDDSSDEINQKPAAKSDVSLTDFTCPICLDCPSSLTELATIAGCTHRFCFDCIDTWAKTENRCPCCKSRFRTINRVEPLPPPPNGRRDKRKRGGIGPSRSPRRRVDPPVNSRQVEDRNQPSATTMNFAFIERILNEFSGMASEHGRNVLTGLFAGDGPNGSTFRFTNTNGNPVMRIERPGGSTGHLELYLATMEGEDGRPGRGRVRYNSGDMETERQIPAPPFAAAANVGDENRLRRSPSLRSRSRRGDSDSISGGAYDSDVGATDRATRHSPFRFGAPRSRSRRGDPDSISGGAGDNGARSPFRLQTGAASTRMPSPRSRSRRGDPDTISGGAGDNGARSPFRFGADATSAERTSHRSNVTARAIAALDDDSRSDSSEVREDTLFSFGAGAASTNGSSAETLANTRRNGAVASNSAEPSANPSSRISFRVVPMDVVHIDGRHQRAVSNRSSQRNEHTAPPLRRSARLRSNINSEGSAEEPIELA